MRTAHLPAFFIVLLFVGAITVAGIGRAQEGQPSVERGDASVEIDLGDLKQRIARVFIEIRKRFLKRDDPPTTTVIYLRFVEASAAAKAAVDALDGDRHEVVIEADARLNRVIIRADVNRTERIREFLEFLEKFVGG